MRIRKITFLAASSAFLAAATLGLAGVRPGTTIELTALPVMMLYALVLVVSVTYALGRWRSLGVLAAMPLLVVLSGIPGIEVVRAIERRISDLRFGRHLPELQSAVEQLDLLPGSIARLKPRDLPESTRTCCFRAVVRRDSLDHRMAVFVVRRQLAYLYDPHGVALNRMTRRWAHHELVAPRWYRLVR